MIITVGIEKGGVGKSSILFNLAYILARQPGKKVLIVDADPESCISNLLFRDDQQPADSPTLLELLSQTAKSFGKAMPSRFNRIDFIPAKPKLRQLDNVQKEVLSKKISLFLNSSFIARYNYVFFDVPPQFGNLISQIYVQSDLVILPFTTDVWAYESLALTVGDIAEECESNDRKLPQLLAVLNRFNARKKNITEFMSLLNQDFGQIFQGDIIRESAYLNNQINEGLPLSSRLKPGNPLKESFDKLANQIINYSNASTT